VNHGLEHFGEGDYFVFANSRNATDPRSRVAVANLDVDAMVVWDYQVPNAFIYGADRMPTGNVPSLYWPTTMTDDVAWRAAVIEVARPVDGGQPASALDLEVYGTTGDATRYDNDPTLEEVVGWAADSVEKFFDEPLAPSASRADGALRFDARNLVKMNAAGETHFDVLDSAGVSIEAGSFSMEAVWVDGPRGPRPARYPTSCPELSVGCDRARASLVSRDVTGRCCWGAAASSPAAERRRGPPPRTTRDRG